jgi:hypothetical protein
MHANRPQFILSIVCKWLINVPEHQDTKKIFSIPSILLWKFRHKVVEQILCFLLLYHMPTLAFLPDRSEQAQGHLVRCTHRVCYMAEERSKKAEMNILKRSRAVTELHTKKVTSVMARRAQ